MSVGETGESNDVLGQLFDGDSIFWRLALLMKIQSLSR